MNTIAPDTVMQKALSLCKSDYQREIIRGEACLSGRDRADKIKRFRCSWTKSRELLFQRLKENGIAVTKIKVGGKQVLVLGV